MKAEDCRPNRSLRTTVKAYLKKQVTLREQAQKKQAVKQAADQAAGAPAVVPAPTLAEDPSSTIPNGLPAALKDEAARTSGEVSSIPRSMEHSKPSAEGEIVPTEAQKDVPQPSIEVGTLCPCIRYMLTPSIGHRRSCTRGVLSRTGPRRCHSFGPGHAEISWLTAATGSTNRATSANGWWKRRRARVEWQRLRIRWDGQWLP